MKRISLVLLTLLLLIAPSLNWVKADDCQFCMTGWEPWGDMVFAGESGGVRYYSRQYWCSATGNTITCSWMCVGGDCLSEECECD